MLGGAVGHNCRIGSGMVIFPGRMIESDVVLVASPQRRVISRSVTYEESDHHYVGGAIHQRHYPRAERESRPKKKPGIRGKSDPRFHLFIDIL